jgi:hypothetical protein
MTTNEVPPNTITVRIDVLRAAANACFDYMEGTYGTEVAIPNEWRWELPFIAAADMSKSPDVAFDVQDLEWSYQQLARIDPEQGALGGPVEMEHLGLLLREISELISPSEQAPSSSCRPS